MSRALMSRAEVAAEQIADSLPFPVPEGGCYMVWGGACALAKERHPDAPYPLPQDVADAGIVVAAVLDQTAIVFG